MTKFTLLMIGCAGIAAASGCLADSPAAEDDQTQVAEAEVTASPDAVTPKAIGQFHLIRWANSSYCLRPQGGSTADVPLELVLCNPSAPDQNWAFIPKNGRFYEQEIVNAQSGKCIYYDADVPFNFGPLVHAGCDIFGTNAPASNALWTPSTTFGYATLMSRVGHRNTGFCIDSLGGPPYLFRCNGSSSQMWYVGVL